MDDETRLAFQRLSTQLDRMDVRHERDMLSVERRLGAIEDALADWAAHYWHHTDHPPRHDAA